MWLKRLWKLGIKKINYCFVWDHLRICFSRWAKTDPHSLPFSEGIWCGSHWIAMDFHKWWREDNARSFQRRSELIFMPFGSEIVDWATTNTLELFPHYFKNPWSTAGQERILLYWPHGSGNRLWIYVCRKMDPRLFRFQCLETDSQLVRLSQAKKLAETFFPGVPNYPRISRKHEGLIFNLKKSGSAVI